MSGAPADFNFSVITGSSVPHTVIYALIGLNSHRVFPTSSRRLTMRFTLSSSRAAAAPHRAGPGRRLAYPHAARGRGASALPRARADFSSMSIGMSIGLGGGLATEKNNRDCGCGFNFFYRFTTAPGTHFNKEYTLAALCV